uniref:Uncharacterized protein n=1 Tax=Setaria viridis TaxID=4556 RepID=A0A4U6VPC9_SETVI|nr:hypothetical protein SEVIR_3G406150v2 [Setaria viridis]
MVLEGVKKIESPRQPRPLLSQPSSAHRRPPASHRHGPCLHLLRPLLLPPPASSASTLPRCPAACHRPPLPPLPPGPRCCSRRRRYRHNTNACNKLNHQVARPSHQVTAAARRPPEPCDQAAAAAPRPAGAPRPRHEVRGDRMGEEWGGRGRACEREREGGSWHWWKGEGGEGRRWRSRGGGRGRLEDKAGGI